MGYGPTRPVLWFNINFFQVDPQTGEKLSNKKEICGGSGAG
jgi:hypothetical protein